jgi:undecaprenyl diphosphate synthase
MDGNGRWAKDRNQPRHSGHRAGVSSARQSIEIAAERGVEYLTLFAFSSENWSRPKEEVSTLMKLFVEALRRELDELHVSDVQLKFIGELGLLDASLRDKIFEAEQRTKVNTGLRLTIALAYGGRWDIIEVTKALTRQVTEGSLQISDINDEIFAAELQTAGAPYPDLLIRTGGEQRISNFLLWDLAYAELWFTDVLWPEFDQSVFDEALSYYAIKQRRFGHTGEQVKLFEC